MSAWIEIFKEHRDLLLGGDLVRLDFPDDSLIAGGVVAFDQSEAIYSFASVARSEVVFLGRVRLPGLNPSRRYRVLPMMLEYLPSGLRTPPWWGMQRLVADQYAELADDGQARYTFEKESLGVDLQGSVLTDVGLMLAPINPDHAVLYHVSATTSDVT